MNSVHLSTSPFWINGTPEIRLFEGKSLALVYPDGEEQFVSIQVLTGHPSTENEGKIAVKVWDAFAENAVFTPVGSPTHQPPTQIHSWHMYLDEKAITSISPGNKEYTCHNYVLRLRE